MQTSLVRCQSSVMRAGPRLPQRVVHARVKLVVRASQGFDPIRLGDSVDSASTPEQVAKNMGLTGPMGANKPINVGPNTTLSGASAMGTANMGTGPGLSGMDRARNVPGSNVSGGVTPAAFERARADAGPPGGVGDGPGFSRGDGGGSGKGSGGSGGGGGGSGGSGGGKGRPSGEGFGGNLVLALGGMALITAAVMLYKAFQPSETQRVDMLVEKADKASAKAQSAAGV